MEKLQEKEKKEKKERKNMERKDNMDKKSPDDESRRDFLKKLIAGGFTLATGLFFGSKTALAEHISSAMGKCSSSYNCSGGSGDCGSSYSCSGQGR